VYTFVILGAICAAAGQIMFKMGATGRESLLSFINPWIISGLTAYAISTILWIMALSRAKLTVVYPFTALTFVLVYLFGALVLDEAMSLKAITGVLLVLGGLYLLSGS